MFSRRYKNIYIRVLLVLLVVLGLHFWYSYEDYHLNLTYSGYDGSSDEVLKQHYFSRIFDLIEKWDPKYPLGDKKDRYPKKLELSGAKNDQSKKVVHTEKELESLMVLEDVFIQRLKENHDNFLEEMPKIVPQSLYKGYGIVYVGGSQFTWLSILHLKTLRDCGTTAPVEIVIPKREEYEVDLCENFLPKYNAKCVLLDDAFGTEVMKKHAFKGYQYKGLAALASSFEKVLMLDSDNTPVTNIDYLFESEVFEKHGLILWPDFWERSTNPNFYKVLGIKIGDRARYIRNPFMKFDYKVDNQEIPLHQREGTLPDGSSESGQVLINKRTHGKALLLSLFYNYYGPDYFYPLLSQGAPGEGDKETFMAAAHKLGLSYYQVYKSVGVLGYFSDLFHGTGMVQYDPVQDYKNVLEFYEENADSLHVKNEKEAKKLNEKFEEKVGSPIKPILAHMNFPKLFPTNQLDNDIFQLDDHKKKTRIYSANPYGFDLEDLLWKNVRYLLCEDRIKDLKYLDIISKGENKATFLSKFCKRVDEQIDWLKSEESLSQVNR